MSLYNVLDGATSIKEAGDRISADEQLKKEVVKDLQLEMAVWAMQRSTERFMNTLESIQDKLVTESLQQTIATGKVSDRIQAMLIEAQTIEQVLNLIRTGTYK